ncbi:MAG: transposase [Verrucomicrobiae bacterium]|nr:transposase [Verrucomicrobiae bacterium]
MNLDDLTFFNPWGEIDRRLNRLPHWEQPGAVYFVTWRLADSLPREVLDRFFEDREGWLRNHPEPRSEEVEAAYDRLFAGTIDEWLDAGHGECLLRVPENAGLVVESLQFFEGERSVMFSFVVMPNHVHVLFALNPSCTLGSLVQSWKRHSAREINRRLGRTGSLWQKDYFDRLVRDRDHFVRCVRYLRRNAVSAGGRALLFESDWAKAVD